MGRKLLSCVMILAILLSIALPANAVSSQNKIIVARGVDVSYSQGEIDWDTLSKHVDFAIIRCGYGQDRTSQDDEMWVRNVEACIRLGIPFGVYLHSHATNDEAARSEVLHVLRLLKGYTPTLPIYLDIDEPDVLNNCTDKQILKQVTIFCEGIKEAGYNAGVYASSSCWEERMNYSEYDRWERWIAQWNEERTLDYDGHYSMFQYSATGSVPGIKGPVDLNFWYGQAIRNVDCSHNYSSETIQAPTCTREGLARYTCILCGNTIDQSLAMTEHNYVQSEGSGPDMVLYTCTECGYSYEKPTSGGAQHDHRYTESITQPTCTSDGLRTYTCADCGYKYDEIISMVEHSFAGTLTKPTCTSDGIDKTYCTVCDYSYITILKMLDHTFGETTIAPTANSGGYTLYACTSCGYSYVGNFRPCLNHVAHNGIIIKQPTETSSGKRIFYCKNCSELLREEILPSCAEHRSNCPSACYLDVPEYMNWAHEGIDVCVTKGWLNNLDSSYFKPNDTVTRAELIAALWRFAGSPKAGKPCTFSDVDGSAWYAEAAAWAQERGIIDGIANNVFNPMVTVTREQFATMLYRWSDTASSTQVPNGTLYTFIDRDSVSSYAVAPISWMVYKCYLRGDIIGGAILLDPQGSVTRAQVSTILTRISQ